MKKIINIIPFALLLMILFGENLAQGQVLVNTIVNDPNLQAEGSKLEVRSLKGGLLVPFVTLDFGSTDQISVIEAPSIPGTPADGLIIFHDGSNGITKGLWYYDAGIPGWYIYSDPSSEYVIDLNNYGEIYEANVFGSGTIYTLSNTYFIPWSSAGSGLKGPEFIFNDDATVNTETGTALSDQLKVIGPDAVYSVNISTTIQSITSGNEITGMLYVNDLPVDRVFFRHTYQVKNFPTNFFASGLIELYKNDRLDFRFSSSTASEGIEIEHLNLRLTKIGEL
jgi:hypothetical protein